MILIGLGSNLDSPWGTPRETVLRAFQALNSGPVQLVAVSSLAITEPFGRKNQPVFVNAVAIIASHLPPDALLRRLHSIERAAGRKRGLRWGPRTLDLDILDYNGLVRQHNHRALKLLVLPHPGITERLFVLAPIAEIAPRWRHPLTHQSARFMIRKLSRLA